MESILVFGVMVILGMLALFIASPLLIGVLFMIESLFRLFPMSKRETEYLKSIQEDG